MKYYTLLAMFFICSFSLRSWPQSDCSPIVIGEVQFACLVQGVGSFSAKERASAIQGRIRRLSQDSVFDPDSIVVKNGETTSDIIAGDNIIASILDTDSFNGRRDLRAQEVADRMKLAVRKEATTTGLVIIL